MKLKIFKAAWGMPGSLPHIIEQVGMAGYDGIELPVPDYPLAEFRQLLADHKLRYNTMLFPATPEQLKEGAQKALELDPLRIVVHAGRDAMTPAQGCDFFEKALALQDELGVQFAFETHRGKLLYSPWNALFYLKEFPELRLTADFSHWVCVCERLPDDQAEALALAARRAIHLHTRVGYDQGPQTPDPAAPEYAAFLDWHETQWDRVRAAHEERDEEILTLVPEYGPPGYMHTLPHTNVPVADLWSVCQWSADRMRRRWKDLLD